VRQISTALATLLGMAGVIVGAQVRQSLPAPNPASSLEAATAFLDKAERRLDELSVHASRASWVQATYITHDTEILAARANQALISAGVELAKEAARFDGSALPAETRRKLEILKLALTLPAPSDPARAGELTRLVSGMESAYGQGEYCPDGEASCLDLEELTEIMAESRDPAKLLAVWRGWHDTASPLRDDYARYVELANIGARELGFADLGAMWRSKYDMPPGAFAAEVDRLWAEMRPFYVSLHTYVRQKLHEKYGPAVVPPKGPIPAHLLGNMWAQDWSNLYPLVAPAETSGGVDLTRILEQKKIGPLDMVRYAERFFTSLGFGPLPATFWDRSLFVKPADREVVCHASAWNIDGRDDLRIKMCIDPTAEDFTTIHHELGHNIYQRAYNSLPGLFRDSANDGFHEAVGDTISLSVTPEYLVKVGLLESVPAASGDIGLLLGRALEKIAFLPFGLVVDQWRWQVFSGAIGPDDYNRTWWDLRRTYQGIAPAEPRGDAFFDPAAKYHVVANVPYTRYFLAAVLQFQFHRALAREAGCDAPLHRCSIYGSEAAGRKLDAMMRLGLSRPWPEALEALTGERRMDARAILDYFAPLQRWLDEQNADETAGW
jgi:peptidyl-dipeptidase A